MNLQELQRNWNALGEHDPFWAVLTRQEMKGGKWNIRQFLATGQDEIAGVMDYLSGLGLALLRYRALDFGCGVGRLTQALADHFDEVIGVDIAPSMLARARALDRTNRCRFMLNERPDLSQFPAGSFDFIYSAIMLQHMRPAYSTAYIREFLRVLAPGGVAVFQVPGVDKMRAAASRQEVRPPAWKSVLKRWAPSPILHWYRLGVRTMHHARRPASSPPGSMEMYAVPKQQVLDVIRDSGGRVRDVIENAACGPCYESWQYCVMKC